MADRADPPIASERTFLSSLKEYWPQITALGVAAWVAFTWLSDQKSAEAARLETQRSAEQTRKQEAQKQVQVRLLEARKPFLDMQLKLYSETAQVVGRLVTLDPKSDEWSATARRYWALYWSELSMVEHDGVESAMARFGRELQAFEKDGNNKPALQRRSYCLAHAIRKGIQQAWQLQIGSEITKDLEMDGEAGQGEKAVGGKAPETSRRDPCEA